MVVLTSLQTIKILTPKLFRLKLPFLAWAKKELLTFLSAILFSILSGGNLLVSRGGHSSVQNEFEANYYFTPTDNIALFTAFYLIANPNNFSDRLTIDVSNLRAQWSF